jgi:hypothetical protein
MVARNPVTLGLIASHESSVATAEPMVAEVAALK